MSTQPTSQNRDSFIIDIGRMDLERQAHYLDVMSPDPDGEMQASALLYSNLSPEQEAMRLKIESWKAQGLA